MTHVVGARGETSRCTCLCGPGDGRDGVFRLGVIRVACDVMVTGVDDMAMYFGVRWACHR